ncbi:MAG: tripartite tricarboxylate transporter family receptor [Firmicutes bacterium]|nr:tripartite tricarboxylate transporter family receptor [Bacillota bacterium]
MPRRKNSRSIYSYRRNNFVLRNKESEGEDMMQNKNVLILVIVLLSMVIMIGGCSMGAKQSVASNKYPEKPITIIVPFAAGGSMDMVARSLEKTATKHLGQPLVVVNVAGGGGTIGLNELAGAKSDGYTIGVVGMGVILQPLYGQTRYHYPTSLEPLVKIAASPNIVATLSEKPWNSLNELISYAKQRPGEIKAGHSGLGSGPHLTSEMLARKAGITVAQVPFKGEADSMAALLGGHVQFIVVTPSTVKEHVKNGTVKVLGVANKNRLMLPGFETVPTLKEQGIDVAFDFGHGIAAPKGLSVTEKARLTAGLKGIVNDPVFKNNMADIGMTVEYLGPEEFSVKWIEDCEELTKIVKETGIVDLIASQKK